MDASSEIIHALLPIYLVTVLGASMLTVGLIEGIAEATASITKVFSGALSDWLGKRKLLALIGYGLAALTKPIFPLAASISWLVAARFIDRIGKGIRGAPRDALVADLAPPHLRGASFGLRQSLDTVGAFLGPMLAIGLMWLTANSFQTVFWIAVVPAFMAVGLLHFAVQEPERPVGLRKLRSPFSLAELKHLGFAYCPTFPKCNVTDERKQGTMSDRDRRSVEEHLARELLNYFTGQHPTGVKYEDQPPDVRELWLGAARVAMKALQESGG